MNALGIALAVIAAFILGVRVGFGLGRYRSLRVPHSPPKPKVTL